MGICTQRTNYVHDVSCICLSGCIYSTHDLWMKQTAKWQLNPTAFVHWVNILWKSTNSRTRRWKTKWAGVNLKRISHISESLWYPWNLLFPQWIYADSFSYLRLSWPACMNNTSLKVKCCRFATLSMNGEPDPRSSPHQASDWTGHSLWLLHQAWHHQYVPWRFIRGLNFWCEAITWGTTMGHVRVVVL